MIINKNIFLIEIMNEFPRGSLSKSKKEFCKAMNISKRNLESWLERNMIPSKYNNLLLEVLPNLNLNDLYSRSVDKEEK